MLEGIFELSDSQIRFLCDRHKGVGADGLMYLLPSASHDFEMKYFNSDGQEGSMCGNGGRCILSFAQDMGIQKETYTFLAVDGTHKGRIIETKTKEKIITLQMSDVSVDDKDAKLLDTGSPHYLQFLEDIKDIDVYHLGKEIRYSKEISTHGVNVNFIEENGSELFVRTYERGVENETLACGTGVTAAAIASSIRQNNKYKSFNIRTLGGLLQVRFETEDACHYTNVWLTGPATFVFDTHMDV